MTGVKWSRAGDQRALGEGRFGNSVFTLQPQLYMGSPGGLQLDSVAIAMYAGAKRT
ncbi:hypothetical protein [Synechococcus sp. M16CYN]|uniref:hypothetical protein n=1 Tax=Synechococcus sp. M16CYN TaxID=3103139 RepID=UPI0033404E2B